MDLPYFSIALDLIKKANDYNIDQQLILENGLKRGLDVSIYADPKFDEDHMSVLRHGLMHISEPAMKSIRDEMRKSL